MKTLVAFISGLVAAPLVFTLAAVAGRLPSDSVAAPPGWEMSLGMRALDSSLEHRSDGLKNPIAANDGAALAQGRQVYDDNCAGCHGTAKAPSAWGSKGFYPRAPQFWQEGSDVSAEEAYAAIHDGVRYSGMGAWRDLMRIEEIADIRHLIEGWRAAIHVPQAREQTG